MTALRSEAIKLVEQMPEDQMPNVIRYIQALIDKALVAERPSNVEVAVTPKMSAFLELEKMLVPVSQELDYDEELAKARDERYGNTD